MSNHITIEKVAQELGVAETTVYKMLRDGEIPGISKVGDKWIIDRVIFSVWRFMDSKWDDSYLDIIKLTRLICEKGVQ